MKMRTDIRWWLDEETPHTKIHENVKRIMSRTSTTRMMDLHHACLYDDAELAGLGNVMDSLDEFTQNRLAFNVVRQAVDTLTAKIAKNQPLPTPTTTGGNFRQRRRARKLGKAFQGNFDATSVWKTSPTVARDCALLGTGVAHNYRVGKTIYHERVLPWEIVVDPREAMYSKPRNIYLRRWIDRGVLQERYPEFREQIENADSDSFDTYDLSADDSADLVLVIEAWHLPSKVVEGGDDKHDGRHVICVSGVTLVSEPWHRQYFPFSVLRMSDPLVGWRGTGLAKQLTGLQYTINDVAEVVQEAHALSGGYILVEAGSSVNPEKLANGRGMILEYNGTRPDWINPQPVHPDTWNFVLSLIPKAFEMTGVSQLSAQSEKPAGIESALALNTFNDFETERFAMFAKQYEEYHIDTAWQQFDLMEEIHDEYGSYAINTVSRDRGQRSLMAIDYAEVRIDRSQFVLEVFATSFLSKKPAARLQEIESFINAGWISPDEGKMLMEMPDFERANNLWQASARIIEDSIDRMLDADDTEAEGVYIYPEPEFNLKLCILKGIQMYLDAKLEGAEDANLQLVLQFVADAKAELDNASGQQAGPATPPLGGPAAVDPNAMPPMDPMAPPPPMPPGPMAPPPPEQLMPVTA